MASVNKVILLGRLGKAPESKDINGTKVCQFPLATSRSYKDRNGQRAKDTEWHNVVLFGRTAEIAQQYLQKGSEAYVEGRIRTRKWTGKDGADHYRTEVVAEALQLGARPQQATDPATGKPQTADQQYAASNPTGTSYTEDDPPF